MDHTLWSLIVQQNVLAMLQAHANPQPNSLEIPERERTGIVLFFAGKDDGFIMARQYGRLIGEAVPAHAR